MREREPDREIKSVREREPGREIKPVRERASQGDKACERGRQAGRQSL